MWKHSDVTARTCSEQTARSVAMSCEVQSADRLSSNGVQLQRHSCLVALRPSAQLSGHPNCSRRAGQCSDTHLQVARGVGPLLLPLVTAANCLSPLSRRRHVRLGCRVQESAGFTRLSRSGSTFRMPQQQLWLQSRIVMAGGLCFVPHAGRQSGGANNPLKP